MNDYREAGTGGSEGGGTVDPGQVEVTTEYTYTYDGDRENEDRG